MLPRCLALCAALLAGWLGSLSPAAAAEATPNVVVIMVDDLGYGDIGPFGSTQHRTPALDRMAEEGRRLTSFYAAPCCTPARAALMTGCYARRVSLNDGPQVWVLLPNDPIGINPEETTVAELMHDAGYATACIGKWHLGDQAPFLPTRHGFDEYYGLPYSNDMWPPFNEIDTPAQRARAAEFNHAPLPLMRGARVLQAVTDQTVLTADYTREAVDFIRRHADRPFFLYLPHTAVHLPIHPGREFQGGSPHGKYADWVEEVDWSTGQVLDTIRELGLASNTLVIFTSDNGHSPNGGGSAGPLRGGKGSTFEGGVRVPCIAWWPGEIAAGSSCDEMAGLIDLLPTCAALTGSDVPSDRILDGASIAPLLLDDRAKTPHDALYFFSRDRLMALRSGPWKLWLNNGELYNLDDDIGETTDVAAANPDAVARLTALADRMRADLGDGTPEFPGTNIRAAGEVEHPRRLIAHDGTIAEDVR